MTHPRVAQVPTGAFYKVSIRCGVCHHKLVQHPDSLPGHKKIFCNNPDCSMAGTILDYGSFPEEFTSHGIQSQLDVPIHVKDR